MSNVYTSSAAQEFINQKVEQSGYEAIQINEGILGIGEWVLLSHDEHKYNFHIVEKCLNCWSSGQTIRRMAKISRSLQCRINSNPSAQ